MGSFKLDELFVVGRVHIDLVRVHRWRRRPYVTLVIGSEPLSLAEGDSVEATVKIVDAQMVQV